MRGLGRLNGLAGGILLGILLVILGVGVARYRGQQDLAPRILMVDAAAGEGITAAEATAISELFGHFLEGCGKVALSRISASQLPAEGEVPGATARTFVVRLFPRRAAGGLSLGVAVSPGRAFRPMDLLRADGGVPTLPQEAFRQAWRAMPVSLPRERVDLFLPKDAGHFWRLVTLHSEGLRPGRLDWALSEVRQVVRQEPDCLAALSLLGRFHLERAYQVQAGRTEGMAEAVQALERALAAPEIHPRAYADLVGLRVESGQVRLVLEPLLEALRRCPDSPSLLIAASYAGRTSGLLDLSLAASRRFRRICLPAGRTLGVDRAFLYAGDLAGYETSLLAANTPSSPFVLSQRAHLALLKGDRTGARELYRMAVQPEDSSSHAGSFSLIAQAMGEILDGQTEAARDDLRAVERHLQYGNLSDGEALMTLVEAHVLMGDLPKGFALAERAFAQGFGCLAWFERNPLLEPLRGSPRWPALRQSLWERQELLERRFPPRTYAFLDR